MQRNPIPVVSTPSRPDRGIGNMPAKEPPSTSFAFHFRSEPTPTLVVTAEMIERERAVRNMVDWVPNPDTLTVGSMARLLDDMEKLWPKAQRAPTQIVPEAYVRRHIVLWDQSEIQQRS